MSNTDLPAMPVDAQYYKDNGGHECESFGLTKREYFCLQMGVPETGDQALDDIIRKGNERKITAMAMQGLITQGSHPKTLKYIIKEAVQYSKSLLEGLYK